MTPPPDRVAEVARVMIQAEAEGVVRDMACHVGDQAFELLKRHGMMMRTTGGAVAMGALAAAQMLNEIVEFGRKSMDGAAEDEAYIIAGAWSLFAEHLSPAVRNHIAEGGVE